MLKTKSYSAPKSYNPAMHPTQRSKTLDIDLSDPNITVYMQQDAQQSGLELTNLRKIWGDDDEEEKESSSKPTKKTEQHETESVSRFYQDEPKETYYDSPDLRETTKSYTSSSSSKKLSKSTQKLAKVNPNTHSH